jgi:L-asparaginase
MHRVHLLTTGGTIEKRYVEQAGSMENTVPQIRRCLSLLRLPDTEITVEELMNIDSLLMTDEHRHLIAQRALAKAIEGIPLLITHGTDTLVDTGNVVAAALASHAGAGNVPVVFTGAMTPFGIEGSDAIQNLTESLLSTRLLPGGVFLTFHGEVFPIHRVKKDRENSRFVGI